jgi:chemotaxis protein MotA
MIAVIGFIVVLASVLGGFTIGGGKILALFHVSELAVVGGTALGTILVSAPASTLKALLADIPNVVKPPSFNRKVYLEALKMMFELFRLAQRDGLVAVESHIENPRESDLFSRYPVIQKRAAAMEFLCDSLRLVLLGSISPHDLKSLLDDEIEVHHEEESATVRILQRTSDALPGIGIVAAVLGVVITMAAINGPIERIGEHVAAALTGTFLGVFLAYGVVAPLANSLEGRQATEIRFYHFIKSGVVALAKGLAPTVAVEFARRSIFSEVRPSFAEMEEACKSLKAQSGEGGVTAEAA